MRHLALALACAACGDNLAPPAPDAATGCTAAFAGNFAETSTATANCPTLAATGTLAFALASAVIGATFAISIDLGPATAPGTYTSATVEDWSATATHRIGDGACEYSAGGSAVPTGSFALTLDAGPHGTLMVTQYVLTVPGTDCGDPDTERITVTF